MNADFQFLDSGRNIIPTHRHTDDDVVRLEQVANDVQEQMHMLRERINRLEKRIAHNEMMNKISAVVWLIVGLFWLLIFLL